MTSVDKEVLDSVADASDQPRILYQCGDCEKLFKSLDLWQQHRKENCQQSVSDSGTNPELQSEPETVPAEGLGSTLDLADSSLSNSETKQTLEAEEIERPVVKEERNDDDNSISPSADPLVSEAATSTSNPEDSSPKKRGANKKPKPEPVLLCVDCGSCFGMVSELVAHRKTQHGFEEALHRCSVCGECFLNTTLFLYHRKQHRQKGEGNVTVAPQQSAEEAGGQSSETAEEGQDAALSDADAASGLTQPELFLCTVCGLSFRAEGELVTHREQKHDLHEPLHSCIDCGEGFMNTTKYLYHRRQHLLKSETEMEDEVETGDEEAAANPQDVSQSSKRLLSPSAAESGSPIPKRGRPSFRTVSAGNALKGRHKIFVDKSPDRGKKGISFMFSSVLNYLFFRKQRLRHQRRTRLRQHQPSSTCQAAARLGSDSAAPCLPLLWQNLHQEGLPPHSCLQPHWRKALHLQGDTIAIAIRYCLSTVEIVWLKPTASF